MISFPILKILLAILVVGLIALAFAVAYLSGRVRNRFYEDSDDPPRYARQTARSASGEAAVSGPRPSPAPEVRPGIPGEIVAAIAAAVYCMEPGAVVTSVRRSPRNGVSAWKMAGLLENTRPFF